MFLVVRAERQKLLGRPRSKANQKMTFFGQCERKAGKQKPFDKMNCVRERRCLLDNQCIFVTDQVF